MAKHVVAAVDEIAPGKSKLVSVAGREIGLFNVNGEFHAISNRCPHEGAPLCQGILVGLVESDEPGSFRFTRKGEILRCPWHGWEFDLRTGKSWCDPNKVRVKRYDVSVEPGGAVADEDYAIDVFAVSVENAYVVIDL